MSSIVSTMRTVDSMESIYGQSEFPEEIVDDCYYEDYHQDDDEEFSVF